jgi:SulP family sulfate permease
VDATGPAAPDRGDRWKRLARLVPAAAVATSYERPWLRGDLLAGLTLWALLIPQGLAYGQLAGLSPVTGLYVGLVGMLAYALLGSSRYMTVGPESSVAMIVAVELGPLADGDQARYIALAGLLGLMVGAALLLGFAARLGILTRLLSAPVLTGYLAGSGIVIALSQLPKVTGIETARRYPGVLAGLTRNADTAQAWAIAIAIGTAVVAVGLSRVGRRLPAALIALALATAFVAATGLSDTVAVVGHVQAGLPQVALPDAGLGDVRSLLAPAGSIALLVFASTILTGQALAARDREDLRPNHEFLALGVANLGAGLVHGFPANGSDSRSFAAAAAGARTQLAGVVAAALLVATLLVLTPLFQKLPAAALGAVVIVTALRLVDIRELRRLWRVRSSDFVLSVVTLAGVLVFGVLHGIAIGVVASLLEVLRRAALPHTAVLGRLRGETPAYRDVEEHEGVQTIPGLIVYRFDAPLFFANAQLFRDELLRLVHEAPAPIRQVIVNAEAVYDIDTTGIRMLERLHGDLAAESVELAFARLKSKPRRLLRAAGLDERVGSENFWLRVDDAVAAFRARDAGG